MSSLQAKLIQIAALHYMHAEARPEGDIAVFIEVCLDGQLLPFAEVETASTVADLRIVLGY